MYDAVWDEIFKSRAWGRYPAEDLVRFVSREIARVSDRSLLRALELGCGPGGNLWFLANESIEFDAIDGSPTARVLATTRLDAEHPGWKGRIAVGDFRGLPGDFIDYDFVIDSEALYCNSFEDSVNIIQNVHRRLRPGGAFWSRTFALGTWGIETGKRIGRDYWQANGGPSAGVGATRLTRRESIPELYGDRWSSITVGEITRHDGNADRIVREWIITARKSTEGV